MLRNSSGAMLKVFLRKDAERPNLPESKTEILVSGLVSKSARRLYRIAQNRDQGLREKKRVQDMDEKRAAAGGVVIGSHAMGAGYAPQGALEGDPMESSFQSQGIA